MNTIANKVLFSLFQNRQLVNDWISVIASDSLFTVQWISADALSPGVYALSIEITTITRAVMNRTITVTSANLP